MQSHGCASALALLISVSASASGKHVLLLPNRFSNPSMKTENGSPLGNAKTADCARKLRESAVNVANYRNSTTTKCKATEKQCEANGKVTCLKDASMCCPPPYKDDCPFTQKCDAKTSRCVSVCNVGFKYCASAVSNKCIPADTCCPGNSNDW
jgi:hypothetical protein